MELDLRVTERCGRGALPNRANPENPENFDEPRMKQGEVRARPLRTFRTFRSFRKASRGRLTPGCRAAPGSAR